MARIWRHAARPLTNPLTGRRVCWRVLWHHRGCDVLIGASGDTGAKAVVPRWCSSFIGRTGAALHRGAIRVVPGYQRGVPSSGSSRSAGVAVSHELLLQRLSFGPFWQYPPRTIQTRTATRPSPPQRKSGLAARDSAQWGIITRTAGSSKPFPDRLASGVCLRESSRWLSWPIAAVGKTAGARRKLNYAAIMK